LPLALNLCVSVLLTVSIVAIGGDFVRLRAW
jgi:hypothetical protein